MEVAALDGHDRRHFSIRVAGPAALMVAKLHKLNDCLLAGRGARIADKDAGDVYRIMQAVSVDAFLARLRPLLLDHRSREPSTAAVRLLAALFGADRSEGFQMAVRSLRASIPAERVEGIAVSFARQVRDGLRLG